MDRALGKEGWLHHERESWVWMRGRFVPYPFQYNLHRLPPDERWACVRGLFDVQGHAARPAHFRDWILATFGDRPVTDGPITIQAPPLAETGNSVPITIRVDRPMAAEAAEGAKAE